MGMQLSVIRVYDYTSSVDLMRFGARFPFPLLPIYCTRYHSYERYLLYFFFKAILTRFENFRDTFILLTKYVPRQNL